VEGFEQRSGIRVALEMDADLGRFRDGVEVALFRVVQEGLTNVLRHSGNATVRIALCRQAGWLFLEVTDEGRGSEREVLMEAHEIKSGVGVTGMRERVRELGGSLRIHRSAMGTTVMVTIPVEAESHG
jgi:two-component system NarL family sensor kinase